MKKFWKTMSLAALINGLALAAALAAAPVLFSPKGAVYTCELPAQWAEGPALLDHSAILIGPGKAEGFAPTIRIDFHGQAGRRAVDRYVARIMSLDQSAKTLNSVRVIVGGKKAVRFQTSRKRSVTAEDRYHETDKPLLDIELIVKKDTVIIPGEKGFHVLVYTAAEGDFAAGLPAFEKVLKTFRLN